MFCEIHLMIIISCQSLLIGQVLKIRTPPNTTSMHQIQGLAHICKHNVSLSNILKSKKPVCRGSEHVDLEDVEPWPSCCLWHRSQCSSSHPRSCSRCPGTRRSRTSCICQCGCRRRTDSFCWEKIEHGSNLEVPTYQYSESNGTFSRPYVLKFNFNFFWYCKQF